MEAMFPLQGSPFFMFNYAQYFANTIHLPLVRFNSTKIFRYQSYLIYLILYSQCLNFQHIQLNRQYEFRNLSSLTKWTPLVRRHVKNLGLTNFIHRFMFSVHIIVYEHFPPRRFHEHKKLLQLSHDTCVGIWYLNEDHTIISI